MELGDFDNPRQFQVSGSHEYCGVDYETPMEISSILILTTDPESHSILEQEEVTGRYLVKIVLPSTPWFENGVLAPTVHEMIWSDGTQWDLIDFIGDCDRYDEICRLLKILDGDVVVENGVRFTRNLGSFLRGTGRFVIGCLTFDDGCYLFEPNAPRVCVGARFLGELFSIFLRVLIGTGVRVGAELGKAPGNLITSYAGVLLGDVPRKIVVDSRLVALQAFHIAGDGIANVANIPLRLLHLGPLVKIVPWGAFYRSRLCFADLSHVIEICAGAFSDCCELSAVRFGSCLKKIVQGAFDSSGLRGVDTRMVASQLQLEGCFQVCPRVEEARFGPAVVLGGNLFRGCPSLKFVSFGGIDRASIVFRLGWLAFEGCPIERVECGLMRQDASELFVGSRFKVAEIVCRDGSLFVGPSWKGSVEPSVTWFHHFPDTGFDSLLSIDLRASAVAWLKDDLRRISGLREFVGGILLMDIEPEALRGLFELQRVDLRRCRCLRRLEATCSNTPSLSVLLLPRSIEEIYSITMGSGLRKLDLSELRILRSVYLWCSVGLELLLLPDHFGGRMNLGGTNWLRDFSSPLVSGSARFPGRCGLRGPHPLSVKSISGLKSEIVVVDGFCFSELNAFGDFLARPSLP